MHGINFGVNGYGIQYSTSSSFLSPTYQKCTNLNGTTYSYVFTSLSPNTTYYFRAYAQNIESLYGVSTISSRTTPAAPTVTTSSATLIDHHTARLNGSYSMGSSGMTINTIGFE
jgi:phosphodiesterase/alkaline phosphatase D-like protein